MNMDEAIAIANYALLKNLSSKTKLIADYSGRLYKDNRYLNGFRRYIGGRSREEIKEPIRATFLTIKPIVSETDLKDTFNKIKNRFIDMYPNDMDLDMFFQQLSEDLNIIDNNKHVEILLSPEIEDDEKTNDTCCLIFKRQR